MTGTRLGPVCQEFCPQRPWSLSSTTISGRSTRNIFFYRLGVWHIFHTSIIARFPRKCTKKKEFSSKNYWEVIMALFISSCSSKMLWIMKISEILDNSPLLHTEDIDIIINIWTLVSVNMWTVSVCMGDFWLVIVRMCLQWTSGVFDA